MGTVLILNAVVLAFVATGIHDWRVVLPADLAAEFS